MGGSGNSRIPPFSGELNGPCYKEALRKEPVGCTCRVVLACGRDHHLAQALTRELALSCSVWVYDLCEPSPEVPPLQVAGLDVPTAHFAGTWKPSCGQVNPQTASCRKEDHKTGHKAKSQLLYRLRENDDELGALQQSTRNVSGLRASSLPYQVGLALVEPCQSEKVLVIAETWTIHEDLHRTAFIC